MLIYSIWIQREGCETEPPELLCAVDEETHMTNPEFLNDTRKLMIESSKLGKIATERQIIFEVDDEDFARMWEGRLAVKAKIRG